jgi:hypothetical protein
MDLTYLSTIVTFILALSIASERLVEIIKGFIPDLNKEASDPDAEGRRRAYLQLLAVFAGILTTFLAWDYIPLNAQIKSEADKYWSILGFGLLASGGSGFWNSILTYITKVKDIKKVEADEKKKSSNPDIKKSEPEEKKGLNQ